MFNISLDLLKETNLINKAKEGDDRELTLEIYKGGVPYNLVGSTIVLKGATQLGGGVTQTENISIKDNVATIQLDRNFTRVPGNVELEATISKSGKQITTFTFNLIVKESVLTGADLQPTLVVDTIEILTNKIIEAVAVKEETERLIQTGGAATKGDIAEVNSQLETILNKKDYSNGVLFFNHRGWTNEAPENTLEAFILSKERGFKGVECDVAETSDGKFVIIHDTTVDRTTNGTGTVNSMTLEQLKALNVDSGNGLGNFENIKIPTLEEFLECCKKNDLIPLLEMKGVQNVENFYNVVKANFELDNCIILSGWLDGLKRIRIVDKSIKLQYLAELTNDNINICHDNNVDIDTTTLSLSKELVQLAHLKNVKVSVYSPNTNADVLTALNFGVDYITSDVIPYYKKSANNVFCGSIKSAGSTNTYENVFMYSTLNRAFSKTKFYADLQATRIKLNNIPTGFKVSIMPFDKKDIYFTDMGWNWGTLTNLPSGTKYVCLYFGKDDGTNITTAEKQLLELVEVEFFKIENTTKCYGIQIANGGAMTISAHSYDSCTVNFTNGFIELTHSVPFLDRGGVAHAEFYSDTSNYTARVKDLTNNGLKIKLYNNNVAVDDIATMYYSKLIIQHTAPTLIKV